jgi:hypothetical protein
MKVTTNTGAQHGGRDWRTRAAAGATAAALVLVAAACDAAAPDPAATTAAAAATAGAIPWAPCDPGLVNMG